VRDDQGTLPDGRPVVDGLPLALGDGALFIMSMAAVIVSLPLVYGGDVDQVVRATVARIDRD